jgi:hypothetical protein
MKSGIVLCVAFLLQSSLAAARPAIPVVSPPPRNGYPAFDPKQLSDSDRCVLLGHAADRANAKLPTPFSNGVQAVHISNDCEARAYEISFNAAGNSSTASKEWQSLVQSRLNHTACSGELTGPLVRHGWRFSSVYRFQDGKRIAIIARCHS